MNSKRRRIVILVRILGNDSLDEVFGYQVNMSILRPLLYHQLRLARLEKPGGKDRSVPNNSGLKYGIRVLMNAKEATQFDQDNGNQILINEILKELEAFMSIKGFRKLLLSLCKARSKGFQFKPLGMIFEVKVDLIRKARIVIGDHVVKYSGQELYVSTTKSNSASILMTIAAKSNVDVMTGDINTNTKKNDLYPCIH